MSGCRRGNRGAQQRLYKAFYAYGLSICSHYAANRQEAEEILHDAFVRAFKYLNKLDNDQAFPGWFRKIMVRQAIDHFQRRRRKSERHEAYLSDISLDGPTVRNEAEVQLSKDDALRCLQQLPPAYRMVTTLYVLEGYTHREISEKLGISEGTSKSNYFKARKILRGLVDNYYSSTTAST